MATRTLQVGGLALRLDEDGFLVAPERWSPEVAVALAATEGVAELTPLHWRVVLYLREFFLEYGTAPRIPKLLQGTGCSLEAIYELFPSGPARGACKVAGLPRPTGCH